MKAMSKRSLKASTALPKRRLFIDPASIQSGWALFEDSTLVASGTVRAPSKESPAKRLRAIYRAYSAIRKQHGPFHEVHIERLVRMTHIYTHYSVGVLMCAFAGIRGPVSGDVNIKSWQKHVAWCHERARLTEYKARVESEDELAAVGMGLYYLDTLKEY